MENTRILKPSVFVVVSLLHAGAILLGWQASKPPEPVSVDNLTFIDLGSLAGDDKPAAEGAPAQLETPPPPPPPPKPIETPKPEPIKPQPAPKVNAVIRDDKPADVQLADKTPPPAKIPPPTPPRVEAEKTQPKPEPTKPQPAPETPIQPAANTAPTTSATSNHGNSNANANSNGNAGSNGNANNNGRSGANGHSNGNGRGAQGNSNGNSSGSGSKTVDGGYVNLPRVTYPSTSLDNNEEGTVKLSLIVEADGRVSDVTITQSTGFSALDNAARRAARSAGYRPKTVDGSPVRTKFNTSFTFKMD